MQHENFCAAWPSNLVQVRIGGQPPPRFVQAGPVPAQDLQQGAERPRGQHRRIIMTAPRVRARDKYKQKS